MMNAKSKAIAKCQKKTSKTYLLRVNKFKEKDIMDRLESMQNKNKYIKKLIREDNFINNLEKGVDISEN